MSPSYEIEASKDRGVENKHDTEENVQHGEDFLPGCAKSKMIIGWIQLYHGSEG